MKPKRPQGVYRNRPTGTDDGRVERLRVMTKAERIFRNTYTECRLSAKNWGFQYNPDGRPVGFNNMITEETVSVRTLNAIQAYINSERKVLALDEKLGVSEASSLNLRKYALEMMQVTLDNSRKNLDELKQIFA